MLLFHILSTPLVIQKSPLVSLTWRSADLYRIISSLETLLAMHVPVQTVWPVVVQ